MALKRVQTAAPEAPAASKTDMPVLSVAGDVISAFTALSNEAKVIDTKLKQVREDILTEVVPAFFKYNVKAGEPVKSCRVTDDTGAALRVTIQNSYSATTVDVVEELFGEHVNDYTAETVKAVFDTGVFTKADGSFNTRLFNKVAEAIQLEIDEAIVRRELPEGAKSPLSINKVVKVKPDFHDRRWKDFGYKANLQIHESLPAKVALAAVANT